MSGCILSKMIWDAQLDELLISTYRQAAAKKELAASGK